MEFANGIFLFEIFHFESHLWNVENVFKLYNYIGFSTFSPSPNIPYTVDRLWRRNVAISVQHAILNGTATGWKKEKRNCVHRLYVAQSKIKEKKNPTSTVMYNSIAYLCC